MANQSNDNKTKLTTN